MLFLTILTMIISIVQVNILLYYKRKLTKIGVKGSSVDESKLIGEKRSEAVQLWGKINLIFIVILCLISSSNVLVSIIVKDSDFLLLKNDIKILQHEVKILQNDLKK